MAKSNYDYNIYNIGNVGIIFGGMVALFLILVITGEMEEFKLSLLLFGVVLFIKTSIVFIRTLKNTNFIIVIVCNLTENE